MPRSLFVLESLESRSVPAVSFLLLPPVGADAPFLLGGLDSDHPDEAIPPVPISGLAEGEIPAVLVEPAEGPEAFLLTVSMTGEWATFRAIDTGSGTASPSNGLITLSTSGADPIPFPNPAASFYEADFQDDGTVAVTVSADGFGCSFLADPATGMAIDADPVADGFQPETWRSMPVGLPFGVPNEGIPSCGGLAPDLIGVTGIDSTERPALVLTAGTAEYILAVDSAGMGATLYVDADSSDGIRDFMPAGPSCGVTLVNGAGQGLYFPDPSTAYYWSWVDSESGEIHVSYASDGMVTGFRISLETGLAIDGDDSADGTQPDYCEKDRLFSLIASELPPISELGDLPVDPVEFANGFMHFLFRGISDFFMSAGGLSAFGFINDAASTAPKTAATLENPMLARALDCGPSVGARIVPDVSLVPIPTTGFVVSGARNSEGAIPVASPVYGSKSSGVRRVVDRVAENIAEGEKEPEIEDAPQLPPVPTGGALPAKAADPEQSNNDMDASETALWLPSAEDSLPADPAEVSVVDAHPITGYWALAGFVGGVSIATMPLARQRDAEFSLRRQRRENLVDSCFGGFGI